MATKLNVSDMHGPMYIESINENKIVARCMMCRSGIEFTNFKDEDIIYTMEHHICEIATEFYDGKKIGSYILVNLKQLEDGTYSGIAKCTICKKQFTFTGTPELLIPTLISMPCNFFKPDASKIEDNTDYTLIKRNRNRIKYKIDAKDKVQELKYKKQLEKIQCYIEEYKANPPVEEETPEENLPETDESEKV